MALAEENDPFSLDIQLNTDNAGREFHRYNDGDEIQRPDIVDDLCLDLLFQARIDRIIHGTEVENGDPATLIVFGFRFHGINEKRRFQEATINITFQDADKRSGADPEVIALWPNGHFTIGEPTDIEISDTKEGEVGADLTGGQGIGGGGHVTLKWERVQGYKKTNRAALAGSILLNTRVRKYGSNNAVRLTLSENTATSSGIVTDLRAVVLLRRKNDTDSFSGTIKVNAKAQFFYNFVRGIRDISGFSPANDQVNFKPGYQYLRPATLGECLETKLREDINEANLSSVKLEDLSGVLVTAPLPNSV